MNLPKLILTLLGVAAGDDLDRTIEDGRVILVSAKEHPRSGWAEAARSIAEAADDVLVWPEFVNADDAALEW